MPKKALQKKGGLRFGRMTRLGRRRRGGTNESKTKKLRFSENSPTKLYYDLEDDDKESKKMPIEEKTKLNKTSRCIVQVSKNENTKQYKYLYSTNPENYPCRYRGVLFETYDEFKEYIDKKEEKLNSGKTTEEVYAEFRTTGTLAPSKRKRDESRKRKASELSNSQ